MAGPIIISDTFLVTLLWQPSAGVKPRNVLGFTSTGDKVHVGQVVAGALTNSMFAAVASGFACPFVSVLPLDGTSASYTSTPAVGAAGGASGDMTPQVAVLVNLKTALRGSAHRGRIYLGPVGESVTGNGVMNSGTQVTMQAAWNTFLSTCAAATPGVELVVVSRKLLTTNLVGAINVELTLATQRRRQSQLR